MIRALLGRCNHRSMLIELLWRISRRNSMCSHGIEHEEVVLSISWSRWNDATFVIKANFILRRHRSNLTINFILRRFA